jgi:hypothetical protein
MQYPVLLVSPTQCAWLCKLIQWRAYGNNVLLRLLKGTNWISDSANVSRDSLRTGLDSTGSGQGQMVRVCQSGSDRLGYLKQRQSRQPDINFKTYFAPPSHIVCSSSDVTWVKYIEFYKLQWLYRIIVAEHSEDSRYENYNVKWIHFLVMEWLNDFFLPISKLNIIWTEYETCLWTHPPPFAPLTGNLFLLVNLPLSLTTKSCIWGQQTEVVRNILNQQGVTKRPHALKLYNKLDRVACLVA